MDDGLVQWRKVDERFQSCVQFAQKFAQKIESKAERCRRVNSKNEEKQVLHL